MIRLIKPYKDIYKAIKSLAASRQSHFWQASSLNTLDVEIASEGHTFLWSVAGLEPTVLPPS